MRGRTFEIIGNVVTVIGITLFGFSSQMARASEGFNTSLDSAPNAIKAAWPKTFAILTDTPRLYEIGTASLVWKSKSGTHWDLYFLTTDHVIKNPSCEKGKVCSKTYIVQNLQGSVAENKFAPAPISGLYFDKVEIVERSKNPDLALIRVSVPLETAGIPDAFILPSSCELPKNQRLFAIGFPSTPDRTNPNSAPIPDRYEIKKRWSQGVLVDKFHDGEGNDMRLYLGTTIDALQGNSGGPVIDEMGTVVGVLVKISDNSGDNGFRFDGNEASGKIDWHSLSVRCEYLQELKTNLESGKK